jgi:hypothetical protein
MVRGFYSFSENQILGVNAHVICGWKVAINVRAGGIGVGDQGFGLEFKRSFPGSGAAHQESEQCQQPS